MNEIRDDSATIDNSHFCNVTECPIHVKNIEDGRFNITYICSQVTEITQIKLALPCLLCSRINKVDFSSVIKKMITKALLKHGAPEKFKQKFPEAHFDGEV